MDTSAITTLTESIALIIPIFIVVFMAVVALIVFIAFRRSGVLTQLNRAMAAGTESPQQLEAERTGRVGEAMVLDCNELETVAKNRVMVYHLAALVLEVRLPGYPPYRVPCQQWFISSKWSAISQGNVVPVRIDQRNPQIVFVDLAAIDRAREHAELAQRDAHARRQAELLGQNRR